MLGLYGGPIRQLWVLGLLVLLPLGGAVRGAFHLPSLISNTGVSKPQRLPFEQYAIRHPESRKAVIESLRHYHAGDGRNLHGSPLAGTPRVLRSEIVSDEPIFPALGNSECHSSSVTEVAPGVLLAVWFAGTEENAPDVAVFAARSVRGNWSEPYEVVPPIQRGAVSCGKALGVRCKGSMSTWNPVVTTLPSGEVLLFYKRGPSPSEWEGYLTRSRDGGRTWAAEEAMPAGVAGPAKNKPLVLRNGRILAPASTEAVGPPNPTGGRERIWKCWVDESLDGGRTWSRRGPIPFEGNMIQPVFFLGNDGNVRMLARGATELYPNGTPAPTYKDKLNKKHVIHPGKKYMIAATADESGDNWLQAHPISLPCPNSGIDAVKLSDGRLLTSFNDMWDTDEELAKTCPRFRCRLSVAISNDDGESWSRVVVLADGEGATLEHSYPAMIQAVDGNVHITYTDNRKTIRHVVLDPSHIAW
mmetsp:Transcript_12181/g.23158  ORF Transcript_12181/g.23158 Transcript_12181/m.23158 type:complete len:472 (-) Transcript_12181:92-1507(-)